MMPLLASNPPTTQEAVVMCVLAVCGLIAFVVWMIMLNKISK